MVKCSECGFLAVRNVETRELEEAESVYREFGVSPLMGKMEGHPTDRHSTIPLCIRGYQGLQHEITEALASDSRVSQVVHKDRDCELYTEWLLGFSPKEHLEMLDRKWTLEFQAEQRRLDRDWQEAQGIKAENRHTEQLSLLRGIHKRELIFLGIGVTLAIAIVTVIGAVIEAGWFTPWFGLFD